MSAAATLPRVPHNAPSATQRRRPIDLVHLARQTHGNRDLEAEILTLFRRQSPQQFARIAGAADAKALFEAAHQLKGSARAIGAFAVAECAEILEGGPVPAPGLSDDRLTALERAVTAANDFIRALVD